MYHYKCFFGFHPLGVPAEKVKVINGKAPSGEENINYRGECYKYTGAGTVLQAMRKPPLQSIRRSSSLKQETPQEAVVYSELFVGYFESVFILFSDFLYYME